MGRAITGRDDEVFIGTYCGIVGGGIDFYVYHALHIRQGVLHGTVHLWYAAEGVGVLNVHLGLGYELAAAQQLIKACGSGYLTVVGAYQVHRQMERLYPAVVGLERHGSNHVSPFGQTLRMDERPYGKGTHVLRAVEQGQTLLRSQTDRLPTHALQQLTTAHELAMVFHLAQTHKGQTQMSQGHQVARGPNRPLLIYHRVDVVVEKVY